MAKRHRHPALTRMGDNFSRRRFYRRDANCPAVLIYKPGRRGADFVQIEVWISNISEGGALLLAEGIRDPIEDLYIVLPGIRAKVHGKVLSQGDFTVSIEFERLLPSALVDRIASLEPLARGEPA
jgi:hypothetical protein